MQRQRGQSVVEFALMAPIIFMMIFGMIFGGIMFMEYMHYSNAVRTAARQIAVISNEAKREEMLANQKLWLENLWQEEVAVKFYKPKVKIEIENNYAADDTEKKTLLSKDVVVNVTFMRDADIPVILDVIDFPPKSIKALQYRMRVEEAGSSTIDDTTTTTTSEPPAGSSTGT